MNLRNLFKSGNVQLAATKIVTFKNCEGSILQRTFYRMYVSVQNCHHLNCPPFLVTIPFLGNFICSEYRYIFSHQL
jgi:hypothetical protein